MFRRATLGLLASLLLAAPAAAADTHVGCDPIGGGAACLLPFPNDYFTRADKTSPTGLRLNLSLAAMPRNVAGKPIDPTDWNRSDGFSPGSEIVVKVPGMDNAKAFAQTDPVPLTDPAEYQRPDAPVVVIDARTGERWPVWTELDYSIGRGADTDADRMLLIRPERNFLEGHRYIVALRGMKNAAGKAINPNAVFRGYRNGTLHDARSAHFNSLFRTLAAAGIARSDLYLAWDFTVASERGLSRRMLHIRDDAFAQLGDRNLADGVVTGKAPQFTLTRVEDLSCGLRKGTPLDTDLIAVDLECPSGEDGPIAYDVKGTMTVPCYLSTPGCAPVHSQFVLAPKTGLPLQLPGNTMRVGFRCRIPKVALTHPGEARPSLYGHGLFGGYGEIGQGQLKNMMNEHDFVYCATDWAGMASVDIPNVATILTDLSHFPTLADRVQQGMLNFLYLGRLMIHPQGLSSQAPFQVGGKPILDTRELFYDGNSQGGIIGGALTAVAPDFRHATLGVLGMNYSTLLTRSTDFGRGNPPTSGDIEYAWPLYQSYPQLNERQLLFSLMQILWDRAEPDGYAQHMTSDPYPNTPPHTVLLMAGYGDHQVSNYAAEVEARTIGAKVLRTDMLRPGRYWGTTPWWGLDAVDFTQPRGVSVFTVWDGGSRPSPVDNVAQSKASPDDDPHEWVRNTYAARAMKSAFLDHDSQIVDTCGGPCLTDTQVAHP